MPRVKRGTKRRDSRRKTLDRAKGFFLTKSKLYRSAQEAVERAGRFAYTGRKLKKRDFRSLWIVRIGAACRARGTSYSKFMGALIKAGIEINRKMLSEMALNDPAAFTALVVQLGVGSAPVTPAAPPSAKPAAKKAKPEPEATPAAEAEPEPEAAPDAAADQPTE